MANDKNNKRVNENKNENINKDTKSMTKDTKSIGKNADNSLENAKKPEESGTSEKEEYVTTVDPEEELFKNEDKKDPKITGDDKVKADDTKTKEDAKVKADDPKTKEDAKAKADDPKTKEDAKVKVDDPKTKEDAKAKADTSKEKNDDKTDSDSFKEAQDTNDSADEDDNDEDIARAQKKARFWKAFDIGQIVLIFVLLFVCLFGTYKLYQNMTAVRFTRALALAQSAQNNGDYADAIKYYEQAIGVDSKSLIAYEELANCYATLNDTENVMNVLYNGWLNTSDQSMLDNYISLKLNSVIAAIQTSGGSFEAVEDVLDVLKIDGSNEDALQLLSTLYSYCMIDKNSSGDSVLFWSMDEDEATFDQYIDAVSSMLDIYEMYPSDELEMLIARYIIPEGNVVWINTKNCSDYALLVKDARTLLGESSSLNSFIACLEDADKVSGVFDSIWPLIESGDVEPFRDFMISDDVISLKEYLISGEDQYLELEMENAFCQEGIVMTLEDNLWTYHFPDFSENPATKGVITLQLTYDEVQTAEEAKAEIAELESEESAIEDASEAVSEDASEDVFEDAVEDDSDDDFENASKDASENASNGASEDASKDASEDTYIDNSEDETDLEENAEDEEVIRSGKISMNYEPSVSGGTYFPHVTYYLTCEYEGDIVNYTYQEVITSEDGTKTRTTINNWGDEDLETVIDEELEEEEEEDTSSDNVNTQPANTNEEPADTGATPNVIVDPETGAMYDPNTGLQIDPGTGFYIDPATGLYIDPNTWTYIDPATGAVVDPNAAAQTPDAATPEATPDAAAQGAGA
ncbi:OCRE domain-containing protein [Butyrivibrio sp. TB]|uniref:OCRE domain-containing protein n=1 Tax=Butyrivibrio sp. TB TaxID=1520809 RepID=UPI0008B6070E|nr:OCRE domain-containing protein [Butyrivibrio sp. TB]SEQ03386.1 TPR repeat-containing protein [Butyrivibrio sp. TB]